MSTMTMPDDWAPKYLTIENFCSKYQCSRSTAYRLAAASQIQMVKLGRATRISVASAESWAASLPAMGS